MNAVTAAKTPALPARAPASRESLREELLGEIFGRGRGRRRETPETAEPQPRAVPARYGKGQYVDLYV